MTTAERLLKIDEGVEKTKALNAELEATLNGGDTGYKSYYHEFWDIYQYNGTRKDYQYAFYGYGWLDGCFKPKYDMYTTSAAYMFSCCQTTNLTQLLKDSGVILDTSLSKNNIRMFRDATWITHVPTISCENSTSNSEMFYKCLSLIEIEKLILKADGTSPFNNTFYNCNALISIAIEGVIGQNGFNVQYSTKLNKASITSIINALSSATSGLTVTLSKTAVNNAFTTDEWNALINTKPNWTISLA